MISGLSSVLYSGTFTSVTHAEYLLQQVMFGAILSASCKLIDTYCNIQQSIKNIALSFKDFSSPVFFISDINLYVMCIFIFSSNMSVSLIQHLLLLLK